MTPQPVIKQSYVVHFHGRKKGTKDTPQKMTLAFRCEPGEFRYDEVQQRIRSAGFDATSVETLSAVL